MKPSQFATKPIKKQEISELTIDEALEILREDYRKNEENFFNSTFLLQKKI